MITCTKYNCHANLSVHVLAVVSMPAATITVAIPITPLPATLWLVDQSQVGSIGNRQETS